MNLEIKEQIPQMDYFRKLAEKAPAILKKINQKVMEECVVIAKFNIGKATFDDERKITTVDNMVVDAFIVPTNQINFDDGNEEYV